MGAARAAGRGRRSSPTLKWTDEDFAADKEGRLPMGHAPDEWSYGDVDAGFKNAALVLDETFLTPDVSHQCLEPRTAMAYWQNGKLYLYTGTQSTVQTVPAIARWMHMDEDKVVFISEYTGGGFGSKITGALTLVIPALLSKKLNAPVMMRISREEEHFIGRARPGIERPHQGRLRQGRPHHGARHVPGLQTPAPTGRAATAAPAGSIVSLLYQPPAMRWRDVTVMTNTPPRSAQSAPGGMQAIAIMEPILAKAARKLGVDQVALRRVNCPEGKAQFGPPNREGKRGYVDQLLPEAGAGPGRRAVQVEGARGAQPKRIGTKVRGVGVALSTYHGGSIGFDGLLVITPRGRVQIQSGIGNLGTEVGDRRASRRRRDSRRALGGCRHRLGRHLQAPSLHLRLGRQPDHARHDARGASRWRLECKQRLKEVAAKKLGGQPDDYEVANLRVSRKGGGAGMSFAEAAQHAIKLGGIYDGHEVNPDVNKATKTVGGGAGRPGPGGLGERQVSRTTAIRIPIWPALPRSKSMWRPASTTSSISWPTPTWAR